MAFLEIKDPKRSNIRHVREQNENEPAIGLQRQVDLENKYKPIIRATEKSNAGDIK